MAEYNVMTYAEIGRRLGLTRYDMAIREMPQCWRLTQAVLKILYCCEPMPHEYHYQDRYIEIKRSHCSDVTPRGFDVVLNKTLEVVMRIKADQGAMIYDAQQLDFVFDIDKCRVYICRMPGAWTQYLLKLGDQLEREFLDEQKAHQTEVERLVALRAAETEQRGELARQKRKARFAPVDDAEIFANVL